MLPYSRNKSDYTHFFFLLFSKQTSLDNWWNKKNTSAFTTFPNLIHHFISWLKKKLKKTLKNRRKVYQVCLVRLFSWTIVILLSRIRTMSLKDSIFYQTSLKDPTFKLKDPYVLSSVTKISHLYFKRPIFFLCQLKSSLFHWKTPFCVISGTSFQMHPRDTCRFIMQSTPLHETTFWNIDPC